MAASQDATLRFWPLESKVEAATFWSALGELKLHSLKLEEGPVAVRAAWTASNHASQPGLLTVSAGSLPAAAAGAADSGGEMAPLPPAGFEVAGDLYVLNTAERILKFDRKAAVQQACDRVWEAISSGAAEADPRLLQRLVLLTYCDLKHYKYRYWFGLPVLQPPQPFALAAPPAGLAVALGGADAAVAVAAACSERLASSGLPAFLVRVSGGSGEGSGQGGDGSGASVETAPLTDWAQLQGGAEEQAGAEEREQQRVYLAVADSSNLAEHPGWPLRNLLLMAAARWRVPRLRVLCLRERRGRVDPSASLALEAVLPELPPGYSPEGLGGWEPNERGKAGPRTADLAPAMDPRQLAEAAVDLNLRLMRWRAAPALEVGAISATRCLLLGAGTLGCSVARTLLGWGVRNITFVDNSRVAYSNPVRQSLFTFDDCLAGGRPKAAAAAEALARIFPGVQARGVEMSVPMPGHPLSPAEVPQVLRDLAQLEELVDSHDVGFLLTDTRESRWLPTLLCAARGRLAINAALGFGGFMVMRHGAPVPPDAPEEAGQQAGEAEDDQAVPAAAAEGGQPGAAAGMTAAAAAAALASPAADFQPEQQQQHQQGKGQPRLGCYFCNDVVAPLNSTRDRSLDQQCTVARPGLSAIAGSLAAELMATVVQHPEGAAAPASGMPGSGGSGSSSGGSSGVDAEALPLGEPPHMIRGQLSGFSQMCLVGQAFSQCTACSPAVVRQYRQRGADFVLEGLLNPKRLEDLTGLTELHRASEAALHAWGSDDEEEGAGEEVAEGGAKGGSAGGEEEWEEL